jgi:hypothetical protein
MSQLKLMRFGRRLDLPSTRQIRHELIVFGIAEDARLRELEERKSKLEGAGAGAPLAT